MYPGVRLLDFIFLTSSLSLSFFWFASCHYLHALFPAAPLFTLLFLLALRLLELFFFFSFFRNGIEKLR
jgi:hypothetical protein